MPPDDLLPSGSPACCASSTSIYTEGHAATRGSEAVRGDLCEEAIRLARLLVRLMPDEGEALGLLALLLLTDARRAARVAGRRARLAAASRTARGGTRSGSRRAAVARSAVRSGRGPTSSRRRSPRCTRGRPTWEATDWAQIAGLYAELERLEPSPVVTVNRAVAVGFADGPRAGLAILDAVAGDERLARYQPLHAARAELLVRAGEPRGRRVRRGDLPHVQRRGAAGAGS